MKEAYVNYVLEEYIGDGNFDALFSDAWIDEDRLSELAPTACDYAFADYGIDAKGKYVEQVWSILEGMMGAGIVKQGDDYSGYWYKLNPTHKSKYIDELRNKNPVKKRLNSLGEEALRRALNKIVVEDHLRPMTERWDETDEGEGDEVIEDRQNAQSVQTRSKPDLSFFASEDNRSAFIQKATAEIEAVEQANLSNSKKSEARGYLRAARALADMPSPPTDIIWTILNRAANIVGIASFFLTLLALIAVG